MFLTSYWLLAGYRDLIGGCVFTKDLLGACPNSVACWLLPKLPTGCCHRNAAPPDAIPAPTPTPPPPPPEARTGLCICVLLPQAPVPVAHPLVAAPPAAAESGRDAPGPVRISSDVASPSTGTGVLGGAGDSHLAGCGCPGRDTRRVRPAAGGTAPLSRPA